MKIGATTLVVALLLCVSVCAQGQKKTTLGIMPVYDASAENYGELVTQHMTQMIFEQMQNSNFQPVLLNPGGAYTPIDTDLVKEFAQMSGVDVVLVTIFQMPDKPRSGPYTLKVDAQLMDPKTGKTSAMQHYVENIDRREAVVEGGYSGFFFSTGASRRFDKQPLGKRSISFAKDIKQFASDTVPGMNVAATAAEPPSVKNSCEITFRVAYVDKKAISKSYGLILNGKEESLWLKEGISTETVPSGPLMVVVNVVDAPHRLPVQHVYAGNTFADCSKPERALAFEIGPAGEAFLRWH